MRGHQLKSAASQIFHIPGLFDLCYWVQRVRYGSNYLRIVNYHSTPPELGKAFESHLKFYARYYSNVTLDDLGRFFNGQWQHTKPGIIISFDDGLRSNFDVAKPLLEQHGFTGWFMVPVNFISDRLQDRSCIITEDVPYAGGRYMMNSAEVKELSVNHVVACHTSQHVRMHASLSPETLKSEIRDAKADLESVLNKKVDCFCWVGGEVESYSPAAARMIHDSGFTYSFMTCSGPILPTSNRLQLHRTHIEVTFGLPLLKFQLSGAMDAFHQRRRALVNTITQIGTEE